MQPLIAFHLPLLDQSAVLVSIGLLFLGKRLFEERLFNWCAALWSRLGR